MKQNENMTARKRRLFTVPYNPSEMCEIHDKWVNNKIIFSNLITNKVTYCITVFADAIYKYVNEYNQTNQSENTLCLLYVSKI